MSFYSIIVFIVYFKALYCWNFKELNLDEDKIELSKIILYNSKAYLAIRRVYEEQDATLVEVPWPESSMSFSPRAFPNLKSQKLGNCDKLQSAISMDVDLKGFLYVLDEGYLDICPPKIVIYHLLTNKEVKKKELHNVPFENLSSLIVDWDIITGNTKIVIGDAGDSSFLIFNYKEFAWWRVMLGIDSRINEGEFIRIDKDYVRINEKSLIFDQLALAKKSNILFATSSQSVELFYIDFNEVRNFERLKCDSDSYDYNETVIPFQYVGNKFGISDGLYINSKNDLYYFYKRDFSIIRWNINTPYDEESMEIVMQSKSEIPCVVQIFSDAYRQLWVLNSKPNEYAWYTVKLKAG